MRKPLLIGGVGLSFALWLWSNVEHSFAQAGEYGTLGLLVAGSGLWWWQRRRPIATDPEITAHSPLQRTDLDAAIATAEAAIARLETEGGTLDSGRDRLAALAQDLSRETLAVAIVGRSGVGKTALLDRISLPAGTQTLELESADELDAVAVASDLTIFVADGDLGDAEFQVLQQLHTARHRLLLAFNKGDRYLPADCAELTRVLQKRVAAFIPTIDAAISVTAAPGPLKVRRELPDGTVRETQQDRTPDVAALNARIAEVAADRTELVLATAWREAMAIAREARDSLNARRRDRALPIIERYQWVSAAAAFANPVGTLDLLATSAVSAQLALDLGEIYQQKLSLQQAQAIATALGTQLMQLGIVELSTQTISGFLKSNALTYVAGGAVQGVSAAYLTRLAGLSLVESFAAMPETGGDLNPGLVREKLQAVFALTKRTDLVATLVSQARDRLPLGRPATAPTAN